MNRLEGKHSKLWKFFSYMGRVFGVPLILSGCAMIVLYSYRLPQDAWLPHWIRSIIIPLLWILPDDSEFLVTWAIFFLLAWLSSIVGGALLQDVLLDANMIADKTVCPVCGRHLSCAACRDRLIGERDGVEESGSEMVSFPPGPYWLSRDKRFLLTGAEGLGSSLEIETGVWDGDDKILGEDIIMRTPLSEDRAREIVFSKSSRRTSGS